MTTPPLRPAAGLRGKAYFNALRALDAAHDAAMAAEIAAIKAECGGKLTTAHIIGVCLRYRLTLLAGFAILEDRHALACGTYDVIRRSKSPAGTPWTVRGLIEAVTARDGWPDAAPGVDVMESTA